MPGILVVEDDENLNHGITFSLKKSGYEVFSAESVKKAKRIASDNNVDVTICDVNLPDGNGLEFVRWMRCNYNTYIICLTALDQEMDQVMGYEAGADDYITKPFELQEVLARVQVQLRRGVQGGNNNVLSHKQMVLDREKFQIEVGGKLLGKITKQEFSILELLLKHPKQVFSKEDIFEYAWEEPYMGETKTLDVHISNIRKKIKEVTKEEYIETVWGIGYRLQQ